MSDSSSAVVEVGDGRYQHNYIQAKLLRDWKKRDNGHYGINLSPVVASGVADRNGAKQGLLLGVAHSDPSASPRTRTRPRLRPRPRRPGGDMEPTTSDVSCFWVYVLALLFLTLMICLVRNWVCKPTQQPVPRPPPTVPVGIPATVRPADEEALDRIAMMLPSRWMDWLSDPPYLPAVWPQYPSGGIEAAHKELTQLIQSNPWRQLDGERLNAHLGHAIGLRDGDIPSIYIANLEPGWLKEAGECWDSRIPLKGSVYCAIRHRPALDRAQETLIAPLREYITKELGFVRNTTYLLSRLQVFATDHQTRAIATVTNAFRDTARHQYPWNIAFDPASESQTMAGIDAETLQSNYEYFAQAAFFELIAHTVEPQLTRRTQQLEGLQQQLRDAPKGNPAQLVQSVSYWITSDLTRHRTFGNATQMRQAACEWSLQRMPLHPEAPSPETLSKPPQHPFQHSTSLQTLFLCPVCLSVNAIEELRNARIQAYNHLVHTLWLSPDAPESYRWHWEEGGSLTQDWETAIRSEWKRHVQGWIESVVDDDDDGASNDAVGWKKEVMPERVHGRNFVRPRTGGKGHDGREKAGNREDATGKMRPLVARADGAMLQFGWPRLRDRKDCKERHEKEFMPGRKAEN
ncbi:Hypothetical predicted protein [Lecanosticta acicola]|uniref:Uncharacterized protein n=1 Tax=Lecanosticta acicola TaxID=111012 RepID=A0AAI8Z6D5_9PEZI|nr:Hypothetical predicted protein [Lecanosticta acicola]